jgi:RNA-directed DNA polymerase
LVKPAVASFLAERGLQLNEEKTWISHVKTGFDFVGYNFRLYRTTSDMKRGNKWYYMCKPSKGNVIRLRQNVKSILGT